MNGLLILVRRLLWVVLITALGGAAFSWWRDRTAVEPSGPAEWPPIPPRPPVAPPVVPPAAAASAAGTSSASFVNSLVDAPEARSRDGAVGGWVVADDDGSCPIGHPIKAKDSSGIFHVPEGRFYARTNADRCYQSADAATADGYRQAKS